MIYLNFIKIIEKFTNMIKELIKFCKLSNMNIEYSLWMFLLMINNFLLDLKICNNIFNLINFLYFYNKII